MSIVKTVMWPVALVGMLVGCGSQSREPDKPPRPVRTTAISTGTVEPGVESALGASYWPRFHGPRGDNISDSTGLREQWPADGPPLIWTLRGIGGGYAGVTMAAGRIYTAGNIDEQTIVTALDMNGNPQWQVANGPAWTGSHPGTRGTPTIDDERIYHESPLGDVVCLRAADGGQIWQRNILQEFGSKNITWALAESLLIDGDRVLCCPGGPQTAVVALDKMTGATVWQSPSAAGDPAGYCSPVLVEYQGLRMILVMTGKALIGVDADTGTLLFRHPHQTEYDINVLSPVFRDGRVFISSGYRSGSEMLKLDVAGDRVTATPVWASRDLDVHHGGVVVLDGYIYGAAHKRNGGRWICLDWSTGETMWKERGVGKGSVSCADGMLYTLSENRKMGLVRASPDAFELISQFSLPGDGEGKSWAHPVICDGRLYVRHGDFLYAYDVRAEP